MPSVVEKCPLYQNYTISLSLFNDVSNCDELKQLVVSNEITATILNPKMIVDPMQVLAAATRAIHQNHHEKMATRSLHSEVLYSLSPSKNISDAFRRFGMDPKDGAVLIIEVTDGESKMADIESRVQGNRKEDIGCLADKDLIMKVYKIKEQELEVGSLLEAITGRIASKDFVNFK